MWKYKKADQKDANHDDICREFERLGATVMELERPLDLLVYRKGWTGWAEIKTESNKAEIKRGQLEFIAFTPMPVSFVRNAADVRRFIQTGTGLSIKQKNRIAVFLSRDKRTRFVPSTVEKVLNGE